MSRYAASTSVSSERSRAEIEQILVRYGADQFAYGWDAEAAVIQFRAHHRQVRFVLPLPRRDDAEFTLTPTTRKPRTESEAERAYEQAVRQRWRALVLLVKAKLEGIESGIVTFEDEFLAQTVLPDNSTAGEFMHPQIELAYTSGRMPQAMPALGRGGEDG